MANTYSSSMSNTAISSNGAAAAEDGSLPVVLFFRNPDYLGSTKVATGAFGCNSDSWLPGTCMLERINYTADLYHHHWKSGDFYAWGPFTPDKAGYPNRHLLNSARKHRSLTAAIKAAERHELGISVTLTK